MTPPARAFDKPIYSAFASPSLPAHLREWSIDTVVLSGSETDICVLSSALGAVDHKYKLVIAIDAVGAGSVCLNSFWAVVKWISALVMPQPGLAAVH
ncbi:MAG: cysteine hydrolase [Bosea sp.]|nr:cysteine hydrolase [Bosea sp. (in: a-proteobacteria)]